MSASVIKPAAISRFLERAVLILAVALGLFFLIRAVLTFIEPSRVYKSVLATPPASSAATNLSDRRIIIDPSFDPFHRGLNVGPLPAQVNIIGEDAPETDLDIILKGRSASENGGGSAILRLPDGQEASFKQGETIFKNVTLDAIYPSHIIISRRGKQERVTFEQRSGLITQDTPKTSPNNRREIEPVQSPISAAPTSLADAKEKFRNYQPGPKKPNTKAFYTGQNTQDILSAARPSPVRKDGRFIGYRLRGSGEVLSQFGLESKDVITQINGQNLPQQISNLPSLFEQISQDPSNSTFTVERDGQILVLSAN